MADRTTTVTLRVADAFSGPLRQFQGGLQQAEGGLTRLQRAGMALESVGRSMTMFLTLPIAGVGAVAVKAALDFDRAMRNVNSIAKVTEGEFQQMRQDVLNLSRGLPQSAQELARGLYDIQSSGFAGAQAVQVLESAAKAASAGLTSTAVSARVITGALNAYGTDAYTAAQVSDILFKTVDKGVLTFEDLAQQLGETMASAAALHVPLETIGAAFATLTRRGINAAEAGTSINRILLSILDPSKEAEKAAKALGIAWDANALQSKGLIGVLQDMMDKTGGSQKAFATLTGDIRALRGVMSLLQDGGELFVEMQEAMAQSAGATDVALKEQGKAALFQAAIFKNVLMADLIEMANEVLPKVIDAIQRVRSAWTKFSPDALPEIAKVAAALAVAGPLLVGIANVDKAVRALGTAFKAMRFAAMIEIIAVAEGVLLVLAGFSAIKRIIAEGLQGRDVARVWGEEFIAVNKEVLSGIGKLGQQIGERLTTALDEAMPNPDRTRAKLAEAVEAFEWTRGEINRQIEEFGEAAPGLLDVWRNQAVAVRALGAEVAELDRQEKRSQGTQEALRDGQDQGTKAMQNYSRSAEDAERALAGLEGGAQKAALDVGRLADAMVTVSPVMQAINAQIIGLEAEQAGLTAAMRANAAAVRDAQEALRKLQETQGRLNKELGEAKSRLQDLSTVRLPGQGAFEESQFQIEQQLKRLRLAEITGKPVAGTPAQFAGMTREQLEQLREAGQLQRSLAVDPLMRQIQAAAQPPKPEMSFEQAMAQVQATHATIARLEGELRANEAAIRSQEEVVRALQAAGQALAEQQEAVGQALARARRAHDMVSGAIKTGIEWHAKLRPEMLKTGLISEEQAQVVDQAVRDMLAESLNFMTTVTDEAMSNLEAAERRYQELISSMVVASNAFAEAFSAVEETGGFQVGGRVQVAGRPQFATGGMVRVGELGPELVSLPAGSRVVPAADTAMLTRSGRSGTGPEVHLHVGAMMGTDRDAQDFARLVHQYIVRERDWS